MLNMEIIHVIFMQFVEFIFFGALVAGAQPLRIWQLSNNTYGYRSDGIPPLYPLANTCGQFGDGPSHLHFPFQAVSFDGSQSSYIDVELSNSDISADWSLTLHIYPRRQDYRIGVFSYYSQGVQGVTNMKLYLANGYPMFLMSYNNVECGRAKNSKLPLNTWSFLSLYRKHGQLEMNVNTTSYNFSETCQYGLNSASNGTLRIGSHHNSQNVDYFDGMMECLIVYNEYLNSSEVSSGETACSSSSIYQPSTESRPSILFSQGTKVYNMRTPLNKLIQRTERALSLFKMKIRALDLFNNTFVIPTVVTSKALPTFLSFHSCGELSVNHGYYNLQHINSSPDLALSISNYTKQTTTGCAKLCSCTNSCSSFSLKKQNIRHNCFIFEFIAHNNALLPIPEFRYYIKRY